jgi:hypothetical protein
MVRPAADSSSTAIGIASQGQQPELQEEGCLMDSSYSAMSVVVRQDCNKYGILR